MRKLLFILSVILLISCSDSDDNTLPQNEREKKEARVKEIDKELSTKWKEYNSLQETLPLPGVNDELRKEVLAKMESKQAEIKELEDEKLKLQKKLGVKLAEVLNTDVKLPIGYLSM